MNFTDNYCKERDFWKFFVSALLFPRFAFIESVHELEFCGCYRYLGFVLCFLVLYARLHSLCFRGVNFWSSLLSFSPDFNLDWCGCEFSPVSDLCLFLARSWHEW